MGKYTSLIDIYRHMYDQPIEDEVDEAKKKKAPIKKTGEQNADLTAQETGIYEETIEEALYDDFAKAHAKALQKAGHTITHMEDKRGHAEITYLHKTTGKQKTVMVTNSGTLHPTVRPADGIVKENIDEGLKLVGTHTHPSNGKSAKVYKDTDWDEHRVKFFKDGKHQTKADYHTDDKDDAHGTAKRWVNEEINEDELNELSKEFLRNKYMPAAGRSGSGQSKLVSLVKTRIMKGRGKPGDDERLDHYERKLHNRDTGYARAYKKIKEEEESESNGEEINEISRKTVINYGNKAVDDKYRRIGSLMRVDRGSPEEKDIARKIKNRLKGVDTAVEKIKGTAKVKTSEETETEEIEISELSGKTMNSYYEKSLSHLKSINDKAKKFGTQSKTHERQSKNRGDGLIRTLQPKNFDKMVSMKEDEDLEEMRVGPGGALLGRRLSDKSRGRVKASPGELLSYAKKMNDKDKKDPKYVNRGQKLGTADAEHWRTNLKEDLDEGEVIKFPKAKADPGKVTKFSSKSATVIKFEPRKSAAYKVIKKVTEEDDFHEKDVAHATKRWDARIAKAKSPEMKKYFQLKKALKLKMLNDRKAEKKT